VPLWFEAPADELPERYLQTIRYTDRFLAAVDAQLADLDLADDTIFCVVGDHGEAFSEHGMMGHERIAYDEVLRIAMALRAPGLIEPGRRIPSPVSSVDLTPTILSLLGFHTCGMSFDGQDALSPLPPDRRVYLSGWMQQGPAGFVQANRKVVYDPENGVVQEFQLDADPLELNGEEVPELRAKELADQIVTWRRNTIFSVDEKAKGQKTLFGSWQIKWAGRQAKRVKYLPAD